MEISRWGKMGAGGYCYRYNGKEFSEELGLYDYEARWYDPATARWTSIDPLASKFASESPYNYAGNNPVLNIDVGGAYKLSATFIQKYPNFARYLQNNVRSDVMNSQPIMAALSRHSQGNLTSDAISKATTWDSGPEIVIVENPGGFEGAHGYYSRSNNSAIADEGIIQLSEGDIAALEAVLGGDGSGNDKLVALSKTYMTLLHETVHYGDYLDGSRVSGTEPGVDFQNDVWSERVLNNDGSVYKDDDGNTYPIVRFLPSQYANPQEMIDAVNKYLQNGQSNLLPTVPE